jgi:hypothetical protein
LAPLQAGSSTATHLLEPSQKCLTPALETQAAPGVQAFAAADLFFAASDGAADTAMATIETAPTIKIRAIDFMGPPVC